MANSPGPLLRTCYIWMKVPTIVLPAIRPVPLALRAGSAIRLRPELTVAI